MSKRRAVTVIDQPLLFKEMRPPKEVFRRIRNYLAGQFVGATRDEALLDEVLKCLFCRLHLEMSGAGLVQHLGKDPFEAAKAYRGIFQTVRGNYPEIYGANEEILLDPKSLVEVLRGLEFRILDATSDPIGDAFEVFVGSESRAGAGQFFTPRTAADFLVRALDVQPGETVIDPACGAGGFFASTARYFRTIGVAETRIAEAANQFHGVEKDAYLAKLARLHVSLLTGGHPQIVCGDSLALCTDDGTPLVRAMPVQGYDVVLTNPPFGVKIIAAQPEVLETFMLARRWDFDEKSDRWQPNGEVRSQVPPQVLFIERCFSLLKDGGRMGIVVPESLVSNKSYRHVVAYLRSQCTVEGVVGMPEALFKTSGKGGTHTKTCLLVLRKASSAKQRKAVFMAEARWCGHDSRGLDIPYDDLPKIAENFSAYQRGKQSESSPLGFQVKQSDLTENILCPRYYDPEIRDQLEALRTTHHLLAFGDLVHDGYLATTTGNEVGKLAYGAGDVPFVRTSDLSNWEIKVDPKHCVERELYETLRAKQDVQPHDILMVKDGTYLIGTCAIVTEYDREIVYQSHLYKIRVLKNPYYLSPFLLLAALSSSVVQSQIRSKQFTQDIIDSLGERLLELVIPIPKDQGHCERITKLVRKVIDDRIEARELARQARIEVLTLNGNGHTRPRLS